MLKQESHFMRFGWWKPYESRGSRTVLRGAGVKLPGLLTIQEEDLMGEKCGYSDWGKKQKNIQERFKKIRKITEWAY